MDAPAGYPAMAGTDTTSASIGLFLERVVPRFRVPEENKKKKGRTLSTVQRRIRCACPEFGAPGIFCTPGCVPGGYLVFGLLSAGFLTGGIVRMRVKPPWGYRSPPIRQLLRRRARWHFR